LKNDKGPLSWLKNLFIHKDGEEQEKKSSKYIYVLVVLLLGTGIMVVGNMIASNEESNSTAGSAVFNQTEEKDVETFGQKSDNEFKTVNDYEKHLQTELKEALETIAGVSDVKVIVTVEATEKQVFEKNKVTTKQVTDETDQEGGKRTVEDTSTDEQLVIIKNGEKEGPIVVETKKPKVSGVLVVAKGADNITIKKWIVEAVTRALDVSSHRVSVMPKK
jgi:stage III sporulation protein AG